MSLETSGDTKELTFAEAFAAPQTEPPTVEPSTTDAPVAPPPESATTSPADPAKVDEQPRELTGPIPVERHKALLEAERKNTAAEKAKWERVQWASELVDQGATAEEVRHALSIRRDLRERPEQVIEALLTEAAGIPELVAQVRSIAGRVLGGGQVPQAQPQADEEPPPDMFDTASGIQGYSAAQQRKRDEWLTRRIETKFAEDNKPIKDWWQSQQKREQQEAKTRAHNAEIKQHVDIQGARLDALVKMGTEAGYYDNDFKAKMAEYAKGLDYNVTVDQAWTHVFHSHVLPTLGQRERSRYDAALRTQANASSVGPKAGAASVPASNITRLDDPRLSWK